MLESPSSRIILPNRIPRAYLTHRNGKVSRSRIHALFPPKDLHARHRDIILSVFCSDSGQEAHVGLSLHVVGDRITEEARFRTELAAEFEALFRRGEVPTWENILCQRFPAHTAYSRSLQRATSQAYQRKSGEERLTKPTLAGGAKPARRCNTRWCRPSSHTGSGRILPGRGCTVS
jgi:hypothetical protein